MDEKVFKRVEKKYLITKEQKQQILESIKSHMEPDRYHQSEVYNIYFDNDNFDSIITSIERPEFKKKLRARSYGGYDKVFIEIKTKLKEQEYRIGYKRRVLLTSKDYREFASGKKTAYELAGRKIETLDDLQIAKEVDYLVEELRLTPKILVYYNRESYLGENRLRITFDEDLSYRDDNLTFSKRTHDKKFFKDNKNIIMEIKAHGVLPLWLVHALSDVKAYPGQFSKIGNIYTLIRKEQNV